MPHVVVKLWPGKSEEQKAQLAEAIVRDVTSILNYGENSVSVGFEEVPSQEWTERVYKPDILDKWNTLAKGTGLRGAARPLRRLPWLISDCRLCAEDRRAANSAAHVT